MRNDPIDRMVSSLKKNRRTALNKQVHATIYPKIDETHFFSNIHAPEYADIREELLDFLDMLEAQEKEAEMSRAFPMDAGHLDDFSVNTTLAGLKERNAEAAKIIAQYARQHRNFDIVVGIVGTFIPFGGLAALVSSVLAQYPLIYEPMSRDLARIYTAQPDQITGFVTSSAALIGGVGDITVEIGREFLQEITWDLLSEMGFAAAASAIPIVGGIAGAAADAIIASTLTWRVGTLISIYYQNGGAWCGDRKASFAKAKDIVGEYSAQTDRRVDLSVIPTKIPSIHEKHIKAMLAFIDTMRMVVTDDAQIIAALKAKGFPEDLISEAIRRSKSK
jgi:uncharacterized protein (DUF697 family)